MAEDKKKVDDAKLNEKPVNEKPVEEKKVEPPKETKRPAVRSSQPVPSVPKKVAVSGRKSFKQGAKTNRILVASLASATKTPAIVMAGIRAAYGWTKKTKLTRSEFLRKRDEWLARPASEV